uniref:HIG1 domain-containing protein n=1 Tax=Panagrolaimus sp. ES5 TaxID=591445 RepID=A0AC34G5T6_9BILA
MSNVSGNPAVIVGMGLTTMALLGMIRKSIIGDKIGTQKYMRYRIIAQFFTVFALVAGVTVFASNPKAIQEEKQAVFVANSAN